ncbi:hypothetical protein BH11MYX4_BH11MYX4_50240 [soil metagenome]
MLWRPNADRRTEEVRGRFRETARLGRLRSNDEPNTEDAVSGRFWMYAWDDNNRLVGTSDARGCGKDIYYDALGRTVGEDFSPCRLSHADYTQGDPANPAGLEVYNTYDNYESGQVQSDGTFIDDLRLATGRLVSVRDRGAHTRFSYDDRGRVRRVARQVAEPASQQGPGIDPLAAHWYASRSDFDNADRPTMRTSGADEGPFAENGGTAEGYLYSTRGLLRAVTSTQHGTIIDDITYEADGQTKQIRYGDGALTKASFTYGAQRRLATYKVDRAAPSTWAFAAPNYPLPTSETKQLTLASYTYLYDLVGNPRQIDDLAPAADWVNDDTWPQRRRTTTFDDLYRVKTVAYGYNTPTGGAVFRSPFRPENNAGDTSPFPLQSQLASRVRSEAFTYDALGNVTSSADDLNATYDRSLGTITNGDGTGVGPNQLTAANGVRARYDVAGNLTELKVERAGSCPSGVGNKCAQWLVYDWDEVGQLARARRWDYPSAVPALGEGNLPVESPEWDLHYAYSSGARVLKSATDSTGVERHTLEVFDTLRFDHDKFSVAAGDYQRHRSQTHVYLAGGAGHIFYDGGSLPSPPGTKPTRLYLTIADHLGSASVTIDHASSEVVERATFMSHGAIESDFRPNRWHNAREPYKFTGKEEDIEVGATYFGARYYNAHLGRFLSADPLAIHALGGDLNPYAYVRGRVMSHVDPLGLADDAIDSAVSSAQAAGGDPPPNSIPAGNESWTPGSYVPFVWSLGQQGDPAGPFGPELALDSDPQSPLNPAGHATPWAPSIASQVMWMCQGSCPANSQARGQDPALEKRLLAEEDAALMDPDNIAKGLLLAGYGSGLAPTRPLSVVRAAEGGAIRVASGGGASAPATLVREIQHGESVANIVQEAAQLTYESGGLEHAVISTQSGQRLLLQGGPGGMSFEGFAVRRVLGHTHPMPTGPSGADFMMLEQTGQRSSWIYELFGGGLTRFRSQ